MRKTAIVSFSLTVMLLFASISVFAQQALPDYTKWQQNSFSMSAVHSGKNVTLYMEYYENLDVANLYRHTVLVLYDEQKRPWIALYTRTILYKDDNKLVTVSTEYYFFENRNSAWSFVKDFSRSKDLDKETNDFLKSQYNLEFK